VTPLFERKCKSALILFEISETKVKFKILLQKSSKSYILILQNEIEIPLDMYNWKSDSCIGFIIFVNYFADKNVLQCDVYEKENDYKFFSTSTYTKGGFINQR